MKLNKIAAPQPWQAIAQRFCSISVCRVALFFSVKCGLLVGENLEEKLSDEYQEFVDAVIEVKKSKDENDIQQMYR